MRKSAEVLDLMVSHSGKELIEHIKFLKLEMTRYCQNSLFCKEISTATYRRINEYIQALYYLSQDDEYIRGLINKRQTQIKAYEWKIEGGIIPDILNEKVKKSLYNVIDAVVDVSLFGQSLLYVNDDNILELVPQIMFLRDGQGSFYLNPHYLKLHENDKERYIYMQDNQLYIGGTLGSIAIPAIARRFNYRIWWYGNNDMLGAIVAKYATRNGDNKGFMSDIEDIINPKNDKNTSVVVEEATEMILDNIDKLAEGGKAVVPDTIDIQHYNLANSSLGTSIELFVNEISKLLEVAILGQAGITTNGSVGSFAKAEIMNVTTSDIKFNEVNRTTEIVNRYLQKLCQFYGFYTLLDKIGFEFKLDDTTSSQDFANKLVTIANLGLRNNMGGKVEIDAGTLYEGLELPLPSDVPRETKYTFADNSL